MRDQRFVAEHRGGPLNKEQHRQLIQWAIACCEHVLPLLEDAVDERIKNALDVAKQWAAGNAATGKAMKASLAAHAAARASSHPVSVAVARSAGQAVATAHMADHSLGAALYALKAVKKADQSVEAEKEWQWEQLPAAIRSLVFTAMSEKAKHFKMN